MLSKILIKLCQCSYILAFALVGAPSAYAQIGLESPLPGLPGQPNSGPQGVKIVLVGTQKTWTKVCGKDKAAAKDVCYTTRDFSAEAGKPPLLAFAVYDIAGVDTKIVRLLLPIGLSLPPGIRLAIDGGAPTPGIFTLCFPKGCFAEAKLSTATVVAMKRAMTLSVIVRNPANNEITFNVPLEGFGKAFDGPAIDPKVLQEQQRKLQKDLSDVENQRKNSGSTTAPSQSPK